MGVEKTQRLGLLGGDLGLLLGSLQAGNLAIAVLVICAKDVVPDSESRGVVSSEGLVVEIMELGTAPKWDKLAWAPGEIITRVAFNNLEQTDTDPDVDRGDVGGEAQRANDRSNTQN
jgi:hypothetical protein